ncbi:MAG: MBL fold metallo-hydrolase [Akkermansia sp.]
MIKLTNLSGANEIGSNSYLLEIDNSRIVLDAGMHPKKEGNAAKPQYQLIGDDSPDTIFITHAHLDHIGTLPVVQELYPNAEVIMTPGTAMVGEGMLHNSVNVMTSKRTNDGVVEYPFFTHGELDNATLSWMSHDYNEYFRVGRKREILANLRDAGHILGSCGVQLESQSGTTFFYTGDVQFSNQTLIPGASFPEEGIDILMMECTHGATPSDEDYNRKKELLAMAKVIRETLENNGAVLIPVFALGKSQELLYELGRFRDEGIIPNAPIYFGGLSTKVTIYYDKLADSTPRLKPGYRLRQSIKTQGLPKQGKAPLIASAGNIYLVSSGMMSEHTVSNVLASQVLPRKNDTIIFVGYSDPDSPAAWIKATKAGDLVRLKAKGGQAYPVNCRIEQFSFSGHATRDALLEYTARLAPKKVLLVHGDPAALDWMAQSISNILPETEVIIPEAGKTIELD